MALRATSYTSLVFRAELKMAADNSQQKLFYLFIGKEIRIIIISQNDTVIINRNIFFLIIRQQ